MKPLKLKSRGARVWLYGLLFGAFLPLISSPCAAQSRPASVRVAYSAVSAGIGTLWLTHEEGYFKKHGLDSHLIYIRGGTTAVQALLAGEIHFGHLSPAPMMTAWAQGAEFVWIGTTTHQMVFSLITEPGITKPADLKGKKIGITRIGSASDVALRTALEHFGVNPRDVAMISLGGIPDILAAMKAGAAPCKAASRLRRLPPLPAIWGTALCCTFRISARNSHSQASRHGAPSYKASRARPRFHGRAHRWRQSLQRGPSNGA